MLFSPTLCTLSLSLSTVTSFILLSSLFVCLPDNSIFFFSLLYVLSSFSPASHLSYYTAFSPHLFLSFSTHYHAYSSILFPIIYHSITSYQLSPLLHFSPPLSRINPHRSKKTIVPWTHITGSCLGLNNDEHGRGQAGTFSF